MIREIMHDPIFLSGKSVVATVDDVSVGNDLLDTLMSHSNECVGMAANMIGIQKCIIAFENEGDYMVMYNPKITKTEDAYETEEGCLSISGVRKTKRYRKIKVEYQNAYMQTRIKTFTGFSAQIIQHEVDHCNGVLI